MNLLWILIIFLLIAAVGGFPRSGGPGWYGASAGYYPSGVMVLAVIVLAVLLLSGRL